MGENVLAAILLSVCDTLSDTAIYFPIYFLIL